MPSEPNRVHLGVDIGQAFLDTYTPAAGHRRYENTIEGINSLLANARSHHVEVIVFEGTGGYGHLLQRLSFAEGLVVYRLNPARVRKFAESRGQFAKTDKLDSRLIWDYLVANADRVKPLAKDPEGQEDLVAMVRRYRQLTECKTAEQKRARLARHKLVVQDIQNHIAELTEKIAAFKKAIERHIAQDSVLKARTDKMQEISGIAVIVSSGLQALMPELGTLNRQQVASLAGVSPFNHDSGQSKGKRYCQGGRSEVRALLYMATLTAIRSREPAVIKHYENLKKRNKPHNVIMNACMRHLIIDVNRRLKPDKDMAA